MPENLDEFRAAFRAQAVAEGALPDDADSNGQPRDEHGRFATRATEPVVESTVEEEPSAVEPEPELSEPGLTEPVSERTFAGRYKTADDLERAYQELERKLGEQSSEVERVRRLEQEMAALRAQAAQPAQPVYNPGELEEWLADNPTLVPQTAADAYTRGDVNLFNAAVEAWYEMSPRAAAAFERQIELRQLEEKLEEKLARAAEPIAKQTQAQQFQAALTGLAAEFPEITDESFAKQMLGEAERFPPILATLREGDLSSKQEAIRSLALMVRGRLADTLVAAAKTAAREERTTASEAKREAAVMVATGSPPDAQQQNRVEQWRESFRNDPEFRKAAGLL